MSNKPKQFAKHPANKISIVEKAYNSFITCMCNFARYRRRAFGKHVGSKRPGVLKLRRGI